MPGYRLEGHIPNEFIGIMMDRLCERHPLPPEKTVVLTGLNDMTVPSPTGRGTAQGIFTISDSDEIQIRVCFGTPENPMPMYDAMQTVAHEYCHALQIHRDKKRYKGRYDRSLERKADEFGKQERRAMKAAGYDYLYEKDKAKGWVC